MHGGGEGRPSLEALERVARTPLRLGNVPQIEARRSFSSGFWLVSGPRHLKLHTKSRYLPKNKPPEPYDAGDLLALWYALRWRDSGRKATKVGKATRGVWHPSSMDFMTFSALFKGLSTLLSVIPLSGRCFKAFRGVNRCFEGSGSLLGSCWSWGDGRWRSASSRAPTSRHLETIRCRRDRDDVQPKRGWKSINMPSQNN